MITAKEARNISGPTAAEAVDEIEPLIREQAKKKERSLLIRDSVLGGGVWVHGGYETSPLWKDCKQLLLDLGYTVEFYYNEGSMAVDMGTKIGW